MKNCPFCDRLLAGDICSAHGYVGPKGPPEQLIPKGIIVMWSGAATAVPSSWALCDGTNGTPDLRERFILGAGATNAVGATGGSNAAHAHSLSVSGTTSDVSGGTHANATVASHASAACTSNGGHDHGGATGAGNGPVHRDTAGDGDNAQNLNHTHSITAAAHHYHDTPTLDHSAHGHDAHGTHAHTVTSTGTAGGADGRPAFYALAFIQKL